MKNRLQKIVRSELVVNSAKLLSANVIAQGIGLIVYPILTRIYAPEDFGLLNLFLSIGGVLVLFATAEYQYAIVLPKEEEKARALVHVCGTLLLIVTGVVVLSVPFSKPIANLFNTPELAKWYWMMPLFVFTMGAWNILNYWYIRRKQFGEISHFQISQSTLSAITKIGMGGLKYTHCGLIIGSVIAPMLSTSFQIYQVTKDHLFNSAFLKEKKQNYTTLLTKYKNFPLFSFPRALLNQLGCNMPTLVLTPIFGLAEIGFFSMGITLAFRPINMICSSIYQVMYQRIAESVTHNNSIKNLFVRYITRLSLISVLLFIALYFILPTAVTLLLGVDWIATSTYIRLMLPWLFMVLLVSTTSYITDIFQRQRGYMIFEGVYFFGRLLALIIGIVYNSMYLAISLFCTISCLVLLLEFIWFAHIIYSYEKSLKQ